MIFGDRSHARILGRKPEPHIAQFRDGLRGNNVRDLLKLNSQQFQRPLGPGLLLFQQFVADEHGPAFDGSGLTPRDFGRLRRLNQSRSREKGETDERDAGARIHVISLP